MSKCPYCGHEQDEFPHDDTIGALDGTQGEYLHCPECGNTFHRSELQ